MEVLVQELNTQVQERKMFLGALKQALQRMRAELTTNVMYHAPMDVKEVDTLLDSLLNEVRSFETQRAKYNFEP